MSKYANDPNIWAQLKNQDDDDDWETDGDYVNDVSEKDQRKGGTADRVVAQDKNKQNVGIAQVRQNALAQEKEAASNKKLGYYGGTTTKDKGGQVGHHLDQVQNQSKEAVKGTAHREFTGNVSGFKGRILKKQAKGGKQVPFKAKGAPKASPPQAAQQQQQPKQAPAPNKFKQKAPGKLKKTNFGEQMGGGAPATFKAPPVKANVPDPRIEEEKRKQEEMARQQKEEEERQKREADERQRKEEEERQRKAEEERRAAEAAQAAAAAASAAEEETAYEEEGWAAEEEGAGYEEEGAGYEEEGYGEEAYAEEGYGEEAYEEEAAGGYEEEEAWGEEEEEGAWGEEEEEGGGYYEEEEGYYEEGAGGTCTAIGDWVAQSPGDLAFVTGDVITIIDNTSDPTGWWTGELNGVQGQFPSTYVQV